MGYIACFVQFSQNHHFGLITLFRAFKSAQERPEAFQDLPKMEPPSLFVAFHAENRGPTRAPIEVREIGIYGK